MKLPPEAFQQIASAVVQMDLSELSEAIALTLEACEVGPRVGEGAFRKATGLNSEDWMVAEHVDTAIAAVHGVSLETDGV